MKVKYLKYQKERQTNKRKKKRRARETMSINELKEKQLITLKDNLIEEIKKYKRFHKINIDLFLNLENHTDTLKRLNKVINIKGRVIHY